MITLALDPSVRSPGLALLAHTELVACDRVKPPAAWTKLDPGQRWLNVAELCYRWALDAREAWARRAGVNPDACPITRVAFERPQMYRGAKQKGDQNDLPGLAGVGMAVAGIAHLDLLASSGQKQRLTVLAPLPAEWAMGTSKDTRPGRALKSVRGQRLLERLNDAERALVPDQHDCVDGACLGLFAVGRWKQARVYTSGQAAT